MSATFLDDDDRPTIPILYLAWEPRPRVAPRFEDAEAGLGPQAERFFASYDDLWEAARAEEAEEREATAFARASARRRTFARWVGLVVGVCAAMAAAGALCPI